MKVGNVSFGRPEGTLLSEYKSGPNSVQVKTVTIDPRPAIDYLRSLEWSMVYDQCPSCYGHRNNHLRGSIPRGHHLNCKLAHALLSLHQQVVFREEE